MKVRKQLKDQLDKELEQTRFTMQHDVIKRANSTSWKHKLRKLWNTEVTIPLIPVSSAFVLIIVAFGYVEVRPVEPTNYVEKEKVLVEIAGNYYWQDELERALIKHEN